MKKLIFIVCLAVLPLSSTLAAGANCEGFGTQNLNCFANGSTADADAVNANFKALLAKIDSLQTQLSSSQTQIQQLQNAAKVEIQSGGVNLSISDSGWGLNTGVGTREFRKYVTFPKQFSKTPQLNLALTRIDAGVGDLGLRLNLYAEDISSNGFQLVVQTWGGTGINAVIPTWTAYVSP